MIILEQHLQSKKSPVPDHGGEDRIVITNDFAAVIDGVTAKSDQLYSWHGQTIPSGMLAVELLKDAVLGLNPDLDAKKTCIVLNKHIHDAYKKYGVLDKMEARSLERFSASLALYNINRRYVLLAGDCQAIINSTHYQNNKKIDLIYADLRAQEIKRALSAGEITQDKLSILPADECPGRKYILNLSNDNVPVGLKYNNIYQNNPDTPLGYFALDGFAHFALEGFSEIPVTHESNVLVLASDGYPVLENTDPVDTLSTLANAEAALEHVLSHDPNCFMFYKSTKGKADKYSFDDRAYLKIKI